MPIQKWSDRIWIAKLGSEPGLSEDLELLHNKLAADRPTGIVLDHENVPHLNSSHLSKLLKLRKRAIEQDCELKLTSINDLIHQLFTATALDKVFAFSPDTTTALAELQIEA